MKQLAVAMTLACVFGATAAHAGDQAAAGTRMFVIDTHYIVDPAKAGPHKESHKKWVEKYTANGTFLYAGPKDDKNGGVIIIDGSDRSQVAKIMAEDSFVKEGIVSLKITEFNPLFSSRK